MIRLVGPLLVATTFYAGSASAAAPAATCSDMLKRACTPIEQGAFDRAAKKPVAAGAASRADDCGNFLHRACSRREAAHFGKGATRSARAPLHAGSNCDAFLKRSCSAQERLHFSKGASTRLALAAK